MSTNQMKRGGIPSRQEVTDALPRHVATVTQPPRFIRIPNQMSLWGNDQYGDCVTAEEAFAKACVSPEIFIPTSTVVDWATAHNVLNGATCPEVLNLMQLQILPVGRQVGGMEFNGAIYFNGTYKWVDWQDAPTLQSAILQGPVKLLLAANQISKVYNDNHGASGWLATGFKVDSKYDHCVSLCGYGSFAWLAQQLNVLLPAGIDGTASGYAMYTWNSIGIIDIPSLLNINAEAYLRSSIDLAENAHGIFVFQANGGNKINYKCMSEANMWGEEYEVPAYTSDKPSAVLFSGVMHLFYKENGTNRLLYSTTHDGISWEQPNLSVPSAGIWGSPAAVVFKSQLYVFHQGNANDLWYGVFDGNDWVADQPALNLGVFSNPTAAVIASKLCVFYTNNSGLLSCSVYDGKEWETTSNEFAVTGDLSVVAMNDVLTIYFQNGNPSLPNTLAYITFDGTNWSEIAVESSLDISGNLNLVSYQRGNLYAYYADVGSPTQLSSKLFASGVGWQLSSQVPSLSGLEPTCAVVWK